VAIILLDPQDTHPVEDGVVLLDRGGTALKAGITVDGEPAECERYSATDPGITTQSQIIEYLRSLAARRLVPTRGLLISSGVVKYSPWTGMSIEPQNGRAEEIRIRDLMRALKEIYGHYFPVGLCNDVEALAPLVWSADTKTHLIFGPDPDIMGSVWTAMFASGYGCNYGQRLPDGRLAFSAKESGHAFAPGGVPKQFNQLYPGLALDVQRVYRFVTGKLSKPWDLERAGASAIGLVYAYAALTGSRQRKNFDAGFGQTIAELAKSGDDAALRAMRVMAFMIAAALRNATLDNVTGGIRVCGPIFEFHLGLLTELGLFGMFERFDLGEPYRTLVTSTPIEVVTGLPAEWSLVGAGMTLPLLGEDNFEH
jgi:hypothetical protein